MNNPKLEKPLLILICCLTVLLSVLIVASGVMRRNTAKKIEAAANAAKEPQTVLTRLHAETGQNELCLTLQSEAGETLSGESIRFCVSYPNGETYFFPAAEDGSLHLAQLPAGEYTAELLPGGLYRADQALHCRIGEETAEITFEGDPVLDFLGNPVRRYTPLLGPNGFLLSNETHTETRVLPVDPDGDGQLDYGIRMLSEGEMNWFCTVPLLGRDGQPLSQYAILAEPILQDPSNREGWRSYDGALYYFDSRGNRATGLREIDGRLHFFDHEGKKAEALGIDVSFYNERIDWEKVKASGIDFAVARIGGRGWSTGLPYGDVRFREYLSQSRAAGVKLGVYFYSTAVNAPEAVEEARTVVQTLNGAHLECPIFLDMEYSGEYPDGRSDRLTKAQRLEIIDAFCRTVQLFGYQAGVYSGEYFYRHELDLQALSPYTIWLANYNQDGPAPDPGARYDIWQFTDRALVCGINGGTDLNVVFRQK